MRSNVSRTTRHVNYSLAPPARRSFVALVALSLTLFAAAFAGGCAIKLAPDYDKAVFDGLTKANEDAMKLFASTNSGPYSKRDSAYDDVIGELNAVQVQIKARGTPSPPPLLLGVVTTGGGKTAEQKLSDALQVPTSADVDTLLRIMNAVRRDDQNGRLKRRVGDYMEAFSIQMAQALAYEKALQR